MSVHVQFETPEDLANKIYEMIDRTRTVVSRKEATK